MNTSDEDIGAIPDNIIEKHVFWMPERRITTYFPKTKCHTLDGFKLLDELEEDEIGIQPFSQGMEIPNTFVGSYKSLIIATKKSGNLIFHKIIIRIFHVFSFISFVETIQKGELKEYLEHNEDQIPESSIKYVKDFEIVYNSILNKLETKDIEKLIEL